jgi:hypothetical protein
LFLAGGEEFSGNGIPLKPCYSLNLRRLILDDSGKNAYVFSRLCGIGIPIALRESHPGRDETQQEMALRTRRRRRVNDLAQNRVRFLVGDVIHPRPVEVLLKLFADYPLDGEVVAETSDGHTPYLVVRVQGLAEAVIVPVTKATAPAPELAPNPLVV